MSAKGTAGTIAVSALALWGVWQVAQTEARHPGETKTNSQQLIDTADGAVVAPATDALGRGANHLRGLAGEVGTLAGQTAGVPAGQ